MTDLRRPMEKRILGIDYGTKRIGLALSDPLRILATAFRTITQGPEIWKDLQGVIEENAVEFVVVGMPFNLKGVRGTKAQEVEEFISELKFRLRIEVVTWDERFTTSLAYQTQRASGMKKKDRRASRNTIDSAAAAIMLQGFLDSTKKSLSC